ncbi:MAG: biotin/lipoyl-containing protein [Pseudomonadota bacterium]
MFATGEHHVNWIAEAGETLTLPPEGNLKAGILAVGDVLLEDNGHIDPWSRRDGWRLNAAPRKTSSVAALGEASTLDPDQHGMPADIGRPLVTDLSPRRFAVTTGGDSALMTVPDFDADIEALAGGDLIVAPMPGKLLSLNVAVGDAVTKGQAVAVMEAMKMEQTLVAPRDGMIAEVAASPGSQVSEGVLIAALAPEA